MHGWAIGLLVPSSKKPVMGSHRFVPVFIDLWWFVESQEEHVSVFVQVRQVYWQYWVHVEELEHVKHPDIVIVHNVHWCKAESR